MQYPEERTYPSQCSRGVYITPPPLAPAVGASSYLSRLDRGKGPDPPPRIPPFLPDRSFSTRATLPVRAASSSSWSFPIVSHRVRYRVLSLLQSSSRSTPQKPGPSPPHPKRMPGLQLAEIPCSPAQGAARRPPSPGSASTMGSSLCLGRGAGQAATRPHSHSPAFPRPPSRGWGASGWGPGPGAAEERKEDADLRERRALSRMLRR